MDESGGVWTEVTHKGKRQMEESQWQRKEEVQRSKTSSHYGDGRREPYKNATTFFVTNFPDNYSAKDLWYIFAKFGSVVDMAVPGKKDKRGRKFGFVRFQGVRDVGELMFRLKSINILGESLSINLPLYNRDRKPSHGYIPKGKVTANVGNGMVKYGASYASVTARGQSSNFNTTNGSFRPYTVEQQEMEWLCGAFVAKLINGHGVSTLQERLVRDGFFMIKVTPMGSSRVLLEGEGPNDITDLVTKAKEWIWDWVTDLMSWELAPVASDRYAWLRCSGVPVHAWNIKFFRNLVITKGEFIKVDEDTKGRRRYDRARVLIQTSMPNPINEVTKFKINGSYYVIKLMEETCEDVLDLGPLHLSEVLGHAIDDEDGLSDDSVDSLEEVGSRFIGDGYLRDERDVLMESMQGPNTKGLKEGVMAGDLLQQEAMEKGTVPPVVSRVLPTVVPSQQDMVQADQKSLNNGCFGVSIGGGGARLPDCHSVDLHKKRSINYDDEISNRQWGHSSGHAHANDGYSCSPRNGLRSGQLIVGRNNIWPLVGTKCQVGQLETEPKTKTNRKEQLLGLTDECWYSSKEIGSQSMLRRVTTSGESTMVKETLENGPPNVANVAKGSQCGTSGDSDGDSSYSIAAGNYPLAVKGTITGSHNTSGAGVIVIDLGDGLVSNGGVAPPVFLSPAMSKYTEPSQGFSSADLPCSSGKNEECHDSSLPNILLKESNQRNTQYLGGSHKEGREEVKKIRKKAKSKRPSAEYAKSLLFNKMMPVRRRKDCKRNVNKATAASEASKELGGSPNVELGISKDKGTSVGNSDNSNAGKLWAICKGIGVKSDAQEGVILAEFEALEARDRKGPTAGIEMVNQ